MRAIKTPRFCLPTLLTLTLALVGCATQRVQEVERDSWLAHHGGAITGHTLDVARSAADPLLQSFPRVKLRVFDAPDLAAYSWADGTVALSRGLVESLTADEIAASVAHELGHLVNDGLLTTPSALTGTGSDEEARADSTAINILKTQGVNPNALATALRKVRAADDLSPTQRKAMTARIARLELSDPR